MKRDKDLIREILLQIEASPNPDPRSWVHLAVAGHSEEEIAHHVQLLDEAGFIEAEKLSSFSGYDWRAKRLTYEGHELLDTIRDPEAWRFTKDTAKNAGVASIKARFDIGKSYARQRLIEHGSASLMTNLSVLPSVPSPSLPSIFTVQPEVKKRMRDFFSSHIRNKNTRRAYMEAVRQFSEFCIQHGIEDLAQVEPIHVAAFVEDQLREHSKPTVKQRLAALRMLFDWMVVGQVLPVNPAHTVRGPKHTQRRGKTPVLNVEEARTLIDAIDTTSLPGLRDRALIGLMVYTFARVGAAVSMKVEDFYVQGRRGWVRLHEKGGKEHEMPTHHNLDHYLEEYIAAAGIAGDRKGLLFRTSEGRGVKLSERPLLQSDVWRMIRRRALLAGIKTEIGCHTFRATGITAYLKNGGKLEVAQQMAAHESARTTGLYDRRNDEISLDEVERIVI